MKWWKFICRAGRLYIWTLGNHDKMGMHKSGKILVWMWGSGHAVSPWAEKILTICSFVERGSETLLSRCNLCRRTTLQGRHQIFGQHKLDLTTFVGCVIAVLFLFAYLFAFRRWVHMDESDPEKCEMEGTNDQNTEYEMLNKLVGVIF